MIYDEVLKNICFAIYMNHLNYSAAIISIFNKMLSYTYMYIWNSHWETSSVIRVMSHFSQVYAEWYVHGAFSSPIIIAIRYCALFSMAVSGRYRHTKRLPFGTCPKLLSRSCTFSVCRYSIWQAAYKKYHANLDFVAIVSSKQLNL